MVIETQTRQVVTAQRGIAPESNRVENNCEARWCPRCAAAVVMVTPENAMGITGISMRAVYRLVESGRVHFAETPEVVLLVCLSSLAEAANDEATPTLELEQG